MTIKESVIIGVFGCTVVIMILIIVAFGPKTSTSNDPSKMFAGRSYGLPITLLSENKESDSYSFRYKLNNEQRCDIYVRINQKDFWQTYILGQTTQNTTEDLDKVPCGQVSTPFVWLPVEYANVIKEGKK